VTIADAGAEPGLDGLRPWPGLDAFSEARRAFFFGRSGEAEELFRRVRRDPVTLLFGRSGLGKTSLLQAGLFPRLRAGGLLPILVRLDYLPGAPALAAQVKATMEREFATEEVAEATPIGSAESLWAYFHRADRRLLARNDRELVPVLVFDQFEEIFTLGLEREGSRAASQSFLVELADLIENRPPETFEKAIEENPEVIEDYLLDRHDYRIVIALREDFLAPLESLRARAPSLGRNRFRLRRMSGSQALDAILKPAPGLITPDLAGEIIRFIGRSDPEDAFGGNEADATRAFEVEPALLSLICSELDERRLQAGLPAITRELIAENRERIIEGFYERALADQPPALRAFIEDELLSDSGFRESISLERARRVLAGHNVPAAALDELVARRLLRIEERLDVARVEIVHDVLTGVIRQSRDSRRLRQAEAEAVAREDALRRERRRARRAHWIAVAMALLAFVNIGLFWWAYRSSIEADRQRQAAEQQRVIAEQQKQFAEQQQVIAEQQKQFAEAQQQRAEQQQALAEQQQAIAEQQRAAATAATERAEQSFDTAVDTADTLVTSVAEKLRPLVGVSAETVRDILDTAETAFDRLAATSPNSQHLRSRQAAMLISFADTYEALGDSPESLRRAQAAREILAALTKEDPTNTSWLNDFASARQRVGDALVDVGDVTSALAEYRGYLDIMKQLVEREPKDDLWRRNLSVAHEAVGDALRALGKLGAASSEYRDALDIIGGLVTTNPKNWEWQRDLSIAHERMGDVLRDQGNLTGALAEYRAKLDIMQRLVAQDATNAIWQRSLGIAHEKVGDVLHDQGDLDGALAEYQADLKICESLIERDPSNAMWQSDASTSHQRVGDALRDKNKLDEALAEYRADLEIREQLVERDKSNVGWLRDLANSHSKIGDILRKEGKLDEALVEYRADLDIGEHLAANFPGAQRWDDDIAISHEKIGSVLSDQKNWDGALAEYRIEAQTAAKLIQEDPTNVRWQRILFYPTMRISEIVLQENDVSAAFDALEQAEKVAVHLKEINPTSSNSDNDLTWVSDQRDDIVGRLKSMPNGIDMVSKMAQAQPGDPQRLTELEGFAKALAEAKEDGPDLAGALAAERERVELARQVSALAAADADQAKRALASALGSLSWVLLLDKKPQEAAQRAQEALALDPAQLWIETNRAHALLFLGRFDEAKAIYLDNNGKKLDEDRTFGQAVLADFAEFRKRGIDTPDMKRIEALLAG